MFKPPAPVDLSAANSHSCTLTPIPVARRDVLQPARSDASQQVFAQN